MKRNILFLLAALLFVGIAQISLAQENGEKDIVKQIKAVVGENKNVAVNKKIVFDGSKSINPKEGTALRYYWDFGDGYRQEGQEVVHSYGQPGEYEVTLIVDNGFEKDKDELLVNVYKDLMLLVADNTPASEEIKVLKKYAAREQVLLEAVVNRQGDADYIVEGELVNSLLEARENVKDSDIIILWTSGSLGLNVMSKFAQSAGDLSDFDMDNKAIVSVGKSAKANARIAQSTYDVLKPEYIMLIKDSALHIVIDAKNSKDLIVSARAKGIENTLIGKHSERAVTKLGITNFLSYSINYLINKGVAIDNIFLLLMLPIIATLIAFLRQILGIKTFGIYTPTIISLAFIATGLKYGLTIFLIILLVATVLRFLLRKFKLLYLPRMAIVLCIVALVLLLLFVLGAYSNKTGMIGLSIFPVLVLIILVEKFISVQIEKGGFTAILLSVETILVSVICYWVVNWEWFKTLILSYPELVLVTLLINIILGRWAGLRLSEYFRFRRLRAKKA